MARNPNLQRWVDFFAFVAIVFIGVAILLGRLLNIGALQHIGVVLAIVVTCIQAFFYASRKRNTVIMITYIIFVIFVLVVYVLSAVNVIPTL